ncbi:MAG: VOC family protein [Leptolyngbyaceae cyanobacterium T60_A2020_046]|nr:VOC family protein [Leptolyngbyaceae cyanobacterium T60_A2020_046]
MIVEALHVALVVTDLQAAAQFYGEVLGLAAAPRSLNFPGLWYQVGTFQIHLIQGDRRPGDLAIAEKWGRNPHLALSAPDLGVIEQRLRHFNVPMQASASGRAAIFVQDPDGNVIELSQPSFPTLGGCGEGGNS